MTPPSLSIPKLACPYHVIFISWLPEGSFGVRFRHYLYHVADPAIPEFFRLYIDKLLLVSLVGSRAEGR